MVWPRCVDTGTTVVITAIEGLEEVDVPVHLDTVGDGRLGEGSNRKKKGHEDEDITHGTMEEIYGRSSHERDLGRPLTLQPRFTTKPDHPCCFVLSEAGNRRSWVQTLPTHADGASAIDSTWDNQGCGGLLRHGVVIGFSFLNQ